jgi:hypothetical protein
MYLAKRKGTIYTRGHVYHVLPESIMLMEINVSRITHKFQRRNCQEFCRPGKTGHQH